MYLRTGSTFHQVVDGKTECGATLTAGETVYTIPDHDGISMCEQCFHTPHELSVDCWCSPTRVAVAAK